MRLALLVFVSALMSGCATMPSAPGKLFDVNGHKMHLYCTGANDASATIVIIAGMSGITPFYSRLQQSLEGEAKTCSYDRAGLGWSEASDARQDADQMASDLHSLLQTANIKPPYVLAGHSLGGLVALRYQRQYSREIAGLAFVDSSYPNQVWDESQALKPYRLARIATSLGVFHLHNPVASWFDKLPPQSRAAMLYFSNQPFMYKTTMGEIINFNSSAAVASQTTNLGDLPVVVITHGNHCLELPKLSADQRTTCEKNEAEWYKQHARLASLSTRGRHIVLDDSDHNTIVTDEKNAAQVAIAIVNVANAARAEGISKSK